MVHTSLSRVKLNETEAEFVVIGGGTAGCIVAARLAEAGHSVIVLEAGGIYRRVLDVPLIGLWAWLRRPAHYVWAHTTEPQPHLAGRQLGYPSGKIVGGSSAVNAMIYSRGHPRSYDRWNLPGWTYADLLPYFRRSEDHENGASSCHGAGGPIGVSPSRFSHPLGQAFLDGWTSLGVPPNPDFNAARSDGAGFYNLSHRHGRRCSAARYVARSHPKLRIFTRTLATRIVFDGTRAVGVECLHGDQPATVRASREVILCAGAAKSPQLLMLSGIGPANELRELGIPILADLPGTGANLRDHVRVPVIFRANRRRYTALPDLAVAGIQYALTRRGLLTSNTADCAAIFRVGDAAEVPDIRIVFSWRAMPEQRGTLVSFETGLIDPHSVGRVSLASASPLDKPRIDPNYLAQPADLSRLQRGIELARSVAATPACRAAGIAGEFLPAAAPLEEHIREHALSAYSPVGTCRIGTDRMAVVDLELRVRGVTGLRVVDASVMPTTVSGNAQAGVIAIAERAADILRQLNDS